MTKTTLYFDFENDVLFCQNYELLQTNLKIEYFSLIYVHGSRPINVTKFLFIHEIKKKFQNWFTLWIIVKIIFNIICEY